MLFRPNFLALQDLIASVLADNLRPWLCKAKALAVMYILSQSEHFTTFFYIFVATFVKHFQLARCHEAIVRVVLERFCQKFL